MNVAVTGASGFIGRHLLRELSDGGNTLIRALSRRPHHGDDDGISWVTGDLRDAASWDALLPSVDTLYQLAWTDRMDEQSSQTLADTLVDACIRHGVRRIVHCSTAVVVGDSNVELVDEDTSCQSGNAYEKNKLRLEQQLKTACAERLSLVIVRPTAVFGEGGKNLIKQIDDLRGSSMLTRLLRASLFGQRRMNLIAVENVVAAMLFLARQELPPEAQTFILSDDDDPANTYREIAKRILSRLGKSDPAMPILPIAVLRWMLSLRGRTNNNPMRRYSQQRLIALGFHKAIPFSKALDTFIDNYLNHRYIGDRI